MVSQKMRDTNYTTLLAQSLTNIPLIVVSLLVILFVSTSISYFQSGIDLTDESFYLLHSSQPENIRSSLTSFGYYSAAMLLLVDGNIFYFRVIGFLTLLLLASFFAFSLSRYISKIYFYKDRRIEWSWILTVSISVSFYYTDWLITPSYNFMVLCGCLLVTASAIRILTRKTVYCSWNKGKPVPKDYFYFLLILIGLHVTLISKPPSALFSYFLVLFVFLNIYSIKVAIILLLALALALLFLFSFHIHIFDGSIEAYLNRISLAWELNAVLNSTLKWSFYKEKLLFYMKYSISVGGGVFISILGLRFFLKYIGAFAYINMKSFEKAETLVKPTLFIVIFLTAGFFDLFFGENVGKGVLLLFGFLVAWFFVFENSRYQRQKQKLSISELGGVLVWLYSFSLAFSIGSSTHPILKSSHSVIFCIGCIALILRVSNVVSKKPIYDYLYIAIILCVLVLNITNAWKKPYRLPTPIYEQNVIVKIPMGEDIHKVDPKTAKYIEELTLSASTSGWKEGMVLVDLTGGTPFASYLLKSKVLVTPWYFGGKARSADWLITVLSHADKQDLNNAWILLAPNGERKFDKSILSIVDGLNFDGYEKVGEFTTGYRNEKQELWKPVAENDQ